MKCEVCKKEKDDVQEIPYTMTVKEDVYSPVLEETLEAGSQITVYLPTCDECVTGIKDISSNIIKGE